jgi:two-component system cell cycle sensor histidine kinase/response regulator CckA
MGGGVFTAMPRLADRAMPVATVLVVEDNAQVRRTIVKSLRANGYAVIEASDSYEAFEVIESRPGAVSLVVTDLVLSGVNGVELARTIQRREPGIRVVYMSAYGDDPWGLRGKVPENQFLAKPFSLVELLDVVQKTLQV